MEITFLGTGTSQGVPIIAHQEGIIDLENPKNWRTRASVHVVMGGRHIQVDAGPEFRIQCLKNNIRWIDTFILTHGHADHIAGMDDLRRFCDLMGSEALPVYTNEEGERRIRSMYPYAILDKPKIRGYPAFKVQRMPNVLEFPEGTIESIALPHGSFEVLGLIFTENETRKRFAYFTDCSGVPEAGIARSFEADCVVLDGLREAYHPSHMNFEKAINVAQKIQAKETWFTHMAGTVDHDVVDAQLPEKIQLSWDGLRVEL
ncbi:MAG: MBL fold metallo-hydrolase [Planctomycetota bacterium]